MTADAPLTLAELVRHRMRALGVDSIRGLARRCGLSKATAERILKGQGRVSDASLRKLADNLALPLPLLRRAAGRPDGAPVPFTWPAEFDRLDSTERAVLLSVGRSLLRARDGAQSDDPHTIVRDTDAPAATVRRPLFLAARERDRDRPTVN